MKAVKSTTKRGGGIEFQVYSQWGEDGIIQYLVNNLDISRKIFIEFGVENYIESNTRFLLRNNDWSGLVIDGSENNINFIRHDEIYWQNNLKAVCKFITAENINEIFLENGFSGKIGILSIDIDGNDYWVWKAIDVVDPDIVICEYNTRLGKEKALTIPYDPNFMRFKAHYSGLYGGASIRALTLLANEKGYALVAGSLKGVNLFFVKRELLNEKIKEKSIDEVYRENQFRDARDAFGQLCYLSREEEQKILKNMPVVDIEK